MIGRSNLLSTFCMMSTLDTNDTSPSFSMEHCCLLQSRHVCERFFVSFMRVQTSPKLNDVLEGSTFKTSFNCKFLQMCCRVPPNIENLQK